MTGQTAAAGTTRALGTEPTAAAASNRGDADERTAGAASDRGDDSSGEGAPGEGGAAGGSSGSNGGSQRLRPADEVEASIARAIEQREGRLALSLCARHHGAAIGRLCMALVGSQAEAEDLTQETLLAAHDGLDGWRGEGSVRGWLLAIARRKCARLLEKRTRQGEKLRLVHDSERPGTDDVVALHRAAERARGALGKIRPSEREALLLRYGGELSFREVGEALSIDEAAARKRVSRGLQHLRGELGSKE